MGVADAAGGFEAVDDGHLDVHKDEVEGDAFERHEGFGAVRDGVGAQPEFFKDAESDLLIGDVVFGDEDAGAERARGMDQQGRRLRLRFGGAGAAPGGECFNEGGLEVEALDGLGEAGVEAGAARPSAGQGGPIGTRAMRRRGSRGSRPRMARAMPAPFMPGRSRSSKATRKGSAVARAASRRRRARGAVGGGGDGHAAGL